MGETTDEVSDEGMKLLMLIDNYKSISKRNAALKMEEDVEYICEIADELQSKGYITTEKSLKEPLYTVTKAGREKIGEIHQRVTSVDEEKNKEKKKKKPRLDVKQKLQNVREGLSVKAEKAMGFLKPEFHEIAILVATGLCIYLLYLFIQDPNRQMFSLLFASLIGSMVLILYSRYKYELKSRPFISFLEWMAHFLKSRRGSISAVSVTVSLVYVFGMMIMDPANIPSYIVIAAILFATSVILYTSHNTLKHILKFYVGVGLVTYSLLLIVGVASLSGILTGEQFTLFDVVLGLIILLFTYSLRDFFGVGVQPLQKMLEEVKEFQ